ncbi:MAG: hypothetical protein AMJ81_11155 [Phycisphaerae bacterium SM23_33]|nr:MAG: hypothetical protein AMJ81_11155 [Phycisphaerae bacterium SM23_33]
MTEPIQFVKLSGSGNDFICIDNRTGGFDRLLPEGGAGRFAAVLCRRGLGIGADGLIFAVQPEIEGVSDIAARFFEPDGSEARLCGNGTACFLYWVTCNGWVPDGEVRILTPAGVVRGRNGKGQYVRVCIPDPQEMKTDLEVTVAGRALKCDFVVTGVPHVITYVDDVDRVDVGHLGPALRHHPRFQPAGANANFVQVLGEGHIALRTFEFGVEAETLACGTGSAAAAILTALRFKWPEKYTSGQEVVRIRTRGGHTLQVEFTVNEHGGIVDVCLHTVVHQVYSGAVSEDLAARALGRDAPAAGVSASP